jgi:hypothetical protein
MLESFNIDQGIQSDYYNSHHNGSRNLGLQKTCYLFFFQKIKTDKSRLFLASFFGLNINLKENILNPFEFMVQVVGLTSKAITTRVLFFY